MVNERQDDTVNVHRENPFIEACERGWMPDWCTRAGIRRLLDTRLTSAQARDPEIRSEAQREFIHRASTGPVVEHTRQTNEQNDVLPPVFFDHVLGARHKCSSALFEAGVDNLDEAEHAMLALTAQRAGLANDQAILDFGCGWGSLALWAAERYPRSSVHAVPNTETQAAFIRKRADKRGLDNLTVEICDFNQFDPGTGVFDRIVSIEQLEHIRNYHALFGRIRRWLTARGRLFVHVVAHKFLMSRGMDTGTNDWLARHLFAGGVIPSEHLFAHFQTDLALLDHWWLSGTHYRDTANAWLDRLDANRKTIHSLLTDAASATRRRRIQSWRLRLMAMAELFGHDEGNEWGIGHYLFEPHPGPTQPRKRQQ
ncbi:class I SAM-dependent methyltransferase [Salinisphaera sp. USBA-960]|nr:class I SAM-dependent methyltransferase [Salifodinibacter halophilus]NNC26166.1 class I SAM-dependent methyltransferase [Salifodinibacter halophilus]